jgi:hypothetical protein
MFKSLKQEMISPAALSAVRNRVLADIDTSAWRPFWGRWVYALAGGLFALVLAVVWIREGREPKPNALVKNDAKPVAAAPAPVAPKAVVQAAEPTPAPAVVRVVNRRPRKAVPHAESPAEPPKQVVVKLLTDDPDIVIYWLVDQTGGSL